MGALIDMFLNGLLKKLLHLETLLAIGVTIVMSGVIYFSITNQREHLKERMTTYGQDMKSLAYAGIKHPMAVGDSPSIAKQLLDIGEELKDTEIVICDFNQRIVFATNQELIGAEVFDVHLENDDPAVRIPPRSPRA